MKIMEFKEFIDQIKEVELKKKLVFTAIVSTSTGVTVRHPWKVSDFEHILHVGENMYLAWNDPEVVYCFIGEYQ